MKKKGYTLVELIAVITILIILLGSGFTIIKMLTHLKDEVEVEDAIYEVNNILSYAKAYARKEKCELIIGIDGAGNKINLYKSTKLINQKSINNSFVVTTNINGGIKINEDGYIKKAGTISIKANKKLYLITIAVGNDLITVKDIINVGERENSEL